MKKILLLLLTSFILSCCNKDDNPPQPVAEIDKLPPATQIGANTMGCLLDGKAFLPGNGLNPLDCVYQYVNSGYYFSLQCNNKVNNLGVLIGLSTNAKQIEQNGTYALGGNIPSNAYGTYALGGIFTITDGSVNTGELKITKLDEVNHIVSGTFWFNIVDFQGNSHQIRSGRFDMQYTN